MGPRLDPNESELMARVVSRELARNSRELKPIQVRKVGDKIATNAATSALLFLYQEFWVNRCMSF